uniref:Uncharacterized protein n=1 Tax=Panagrellus redivivus TaxID=6233 RepID=A0A7E4V8X7_PANRE
MSTRNHYLCTFELPNAFHFVYREQKTDVNRKLLSAPKFTSSSAASAHPSSTVVRIFPLLSWRACCRNIVRAPKRQAVRLWP